MEVPCYSPSRSPWKHCASTEARWKAHERIMEEPWKFPWMKVLPRKSHGNRTDFPMESSMKGLCFHGISMEVPCRRDELLCLDYSSQLLSRIPANQQKFDLVSSTLIYGRTPHGTLRISTEDSTPSVFLPGKKMIADSRTNLTSILSLQHVKIHQAPIRLLQATHLMERLFCAF